MSGAYRNFIKVLEKWPLDSAKKGKDIGEAIRLLLTSHFPSGPTSVLQDEKYINRQIQSSKLLSDNHFLNQNPRVYDSTFTGVEHEHLKTITSTEMMAEIAGASRIRLTLMERIRGLGSST
jgi:hypothetical protein